MMACAVGGINNEDVIRSFADTGKAFVDLG
ncbi:hypothetical protein BH10PSE7_BH10PSE7_18080 [soil metagenome]